MSICNCRRGWDWPRARSGLANCEPAALLARGLAGCPANARIGFGSALIAVPTEDESVLEEGNLTALVGEPNNEHLEVLFYAEGRSPVAAQLVFPGQILDDSGPFSGRLNAAIPLIPTWPGGGDIVVMRMTFTIGPLGLTYYRRVLARIVPFRPRGIVVPRRCPRGGFPFRVDIAFLDGSRASATSTVPCPLGNRGHGADASSSIARVPIVDRGMRSASTLRSLRPRPA